jgi:hypothetical protein
VLRGGQQRFDLFTQEINDARVSQRGRVTQILVAHQDLTQQATDDLPRPCLGELLTITHKRVRNRAPPLPTTTPDYIRTHTGVIMTKSGEATGPMSVRTWSRSSKMSSSCSSTPSSSETKQQIPSLKQCYFHIRPAHTTHPLMGWGNPMVAASATES